MNPSKINPTFLSRKHKEINQTNHTFSSFSMNWLVWNKWNHMKVHQKKKKKVSLRKQKRTIWSNTKVWVKEQTLTHLPWAKAIAEQSVRIGFCWGIFRVETANSFLLKTACTWKSLVAIRDIYIYIYIIGESTCIWATTFSIAPKFSMKLQTYHNKLKNEHGHKSKSVIRDKAVCHAWWSKLN